MLRLLPHLLGPYSDSLLPDLSSLVLPKMQRKMDTKSI